MKVVLVPLDGSELAERVVPFATTIATMSGWSLLLLRAVNTLSAPTDAAGLALKQAAQEALDAVAASLAADAVRVATRVVDGQAETHILEATADEDVRLVVMSTHGRGGLGRFIYGSVADTVLRHTPVPVLIVPPHGLERWPADERIKILVPLDGSELSASVLSPACELADVLGGSLLLLTLVESSRFASYSAGYVYGEPDENDEDLVAAHAQLEDVAAGLRTRTRPVEVKALFGTPFFDVAAIARDVGAHAIAIATHGRGGLGRALLGSVATATLQRSDVPLLIVRPDPMDQKWEAAPGCQPVALPDEARSSR
jgi:nucleotide-binding universal stress UspA family protein